MGVKKRLKITGIVFLIIFLISFFMLKSLFSSFFWSFIISVFYFFWSDPEYRRRVRLNDLRKKEQKDYESNVMREEYLKEKARIKAQNEQKDYEDRFNFGGFNADLGLSKKLRKRKKYRER